MSTSAPPPGPEYLEQGSGVAVPSRRGAGRRGALAAGAVLVLAAAGGGVWAATSFLGAGPQPAEALPDSTIGYVGIDLDPSGGQKVEALRTLREFEAFRDGIGLDTDDDVRRFLFEETLGAACGSLDYDEAVEPWLGHRAAVAAVDTGDGAPVPVVVLQVQDADAAGSGLEELAGCLGEEQLAWSVDGDWAVLAEDQETADRVADDAAAAPLVEDEDYTEWTEEAGDPGILTVYAAPEAGAYLADAIGPFLGLGAAMPFSYEPSVPGGNGELPPSDGAEELTAALEEFRGMAATLRFDDGSVELEVAAGSAATREVEAAGDLAELVGTLPDDTAVALGLGLGEGWFAALADGMAGGADAGDLEALVEGVTGVSGLELPEDLETLTAGGLALAVHEDLDPEAFFTGTLDALPVALTMRGDADDIESVLDKVAGSSPLAAQLLGRTVADDTVVVGPDDAWRDEIAAGGSLGDTERFESVVGELDDAAGVLYLDLDANLFAGLAGGDEAVARNLEPLSALGFTSWLDDDVSRTVVRIATE